MSNLSFKRWLLEQIQSILSKQVSPAPFILWCDPQREWKELLQKTCGVVAELWVDEGHELLLRQRFAKVERAKKLWTALYFCLDFDSSFSISSHHAKNLQGSGYRLTASYHPTR